MIDILANPIWAHPALNVHDFIVLVIITLIVECGLIGYICYGMDLKRNQILGIEFAIIVANILTAGIGWVTLQTVFW